MAATNLILSITDSSGPTPWASWLSWGSAGISYGDDDDIIKHLSNKNHNFNLNSAFLQMFLQIIVLDLKKDNIALLFNLFHNTYNSAFMSS